MTSTFSKKILTPVLNYNCWGTGLGAILNVPLHETLSFLQLKVKIKLKIFSPGQSYKTYKIFSLIGLIPDFKFQILFPSFSLGQVGLVIISRSVAIHTSLSSTESGIRILATTDLNITNRYNESRLM